MPEVLDEVVEDEEMEVKEEELLDEIDDEESDETPTRTRRILNENNEYVFETLDAAKVGKSQLTYENGEKVDGYRVFTVGKGEYDPDTKKWSEGNKGFVVAGSAMHACQLYLDSNGINLELAEPKRRGGGRGKSKIEETLLQFGKMMVFQAQDGKNPDNGWKDNTPQNFKDQWQRMFAVGGSHAHYRDLETGVWKDATTS